MGWLKLTQWGRWSVVCPVANSRLWARLGGSIHRRALRDRFTNPALPAPSPPPPPLPPSLPSPPPTPGLYTSFPLRELARKGRRVCTCVYVYLPNNPQSHIDRLEWPELPSRFRNSLVNDFPRFDSAVRSVSLKTTAASRVLSRVSFICVACGKVGPHSRFESRATT